MSQLIEPVARLIESFSRLPGVGPKTAQRLTYHLLRAPDTEARALAAALISVRDDVVFCEQCFDISTGPLCPICSDPMRDDAQPRVITPGVGADPAQRAGADVEAALAEDDVVPYRHERRRERAGLRVRSAQQVIRQPLRRLGADARQA